jgi:hypothetical protein
MVNSPEDDLSAQKALQNIVQGQQAENLLDFDADTSSTETSSVGGGLAATAELAKTPAAANLISGTSVNPLDDLVSIFGGAGLGGGSAPGSGVQSPLGGMNGFVGMGAMSPPSAGGVQQSWGSFGATTAASPPQQWGGAMSPPMGMGGVMSPPMGGLGAMSPPIPATTPVIPAKPPQQQQASDDLLGLF